MVTRKSKQSDPVPATPVPEPAPPPVLSPPKRDKPPEPTAAPKKYVCVQETFWRGRRWRPGETTGDPGAEGNCFREA